MPLSLKKTDPNFKFEVASTPGGENIARCFACGTCTAGCPVREIEKTYNPRRIIRLALLGFKDLVLKSDFIWLCSACYTCTERCPQDVAITDLMTALKNIAVKEGYVHRSYVEQVKALEAYDGLYEIGDFDNKKREKHNLPQIKREQGTIKKLMEETGVISIIRRGGKE